MTALHIRTCLLLVLLGFVILATPAAAIGCEDDCPPRCGDCGDCPLPADLPPAEEIRPAIGGSEQLPIRAQMPVNAPLRARDHVPLSAA
jgi:hypothetical protein